MKKLAIISGIFLILSNLPPLKSLFEVFLGEVKYYTTKDHGCNGYEYSSKGATFEAVVRRFDNYGETCQINNVKIYRTFTMKPYKFWLWREYLVHPKYRLPYLQMPENYDYDLLNFRCKK